MKRTKDAVVRYTKHTLPSKLCKVCGRPFNWRKKWARSWDTVTVCSERCRRRRPSQDEMAL